MCSSSTTTHESLCRASLFSILLISVLPFSIVQTSLAPVSP